MGNFWTDASKLIKDADGFGPPQLGGVVNIKWNSFTYQDTTAKKLFTLPKGAQIVGWIVAPTAGFNGTTPVLDLGDGMTADRFVADLALADNTNTIVAGFDGAEMFAPLAEDTGVYADYADSGGGSAGAAAVGCLYVIV